MSRYTTDMPTSARSTRSGPSKGDALGLRDLTVAEVLGHLPDPLLALGPDWTVLYMNVAAERLLDCRAEDLAGTNIWDAFPEAVESRVEYARAMRDGVTVQFTEFYAPLGQWFSVQAVPHRLGLSVFFHDIDALKAAEQRAARLADGLSAREKVASAIAADEGLPEIFELVCRQSVELLNGSDAWLIRCAEPGYEVVGTTVTDADGLGVGARLTVLPAAGVVPICRAGEGGARCALTGRSRVARRSRPTRGCVTSPTGRRGRGERTSAGGVGVARLDRCADRLGEPAFLACPA